MHVCLILGGMGVNQDLHREPPLHWPWGASIPSILQALSNYRCHAIDMHGVPWGACAARNLHTAIALLGKIRERGIEAGSEGLNVQPYAVVNRRRSRHLALEVPRPCLFHITPNDETRGMESCEARTAGKSNGLWPVGTSGKDGGTCGGSVVERMKSAGCRCDGRCKYGSCPLVTLSPCGWGE